MLTHVGLMFTTNSLLFVPFRFVCYIFLNYIVAITRISNLNNFGNTLSDCAFSVTMWMKFFPRNSYLVCNLERHQKTRAISEIMFLSFESCLNLINYFYLVSVHLLSQKTRMISVKC